MHLLPTNLASVANIAAKKDTKYAICGVHIKLNPDATYMVEATDTRRLVRVEGVCEDADESPLANYDPIKNAPNGKCEAIVSSTAFRDFFTKAQKTTKKEAARKPIFGHVATVIGERLTTLGATNLLQSPVESLVNVEGRYPPVDAILPKGPPVAKFKVDAKLLAEVLEAIAPFTPNDQNHCVEVQLFDLKGEKPILVKTSNGHQNTTALMMPLS